jgi:hypothetical protein
VSKSIERYAICESAAERAIVVQSAIDSINSVGGRFLKRDDPSEPVSIWCDVL